MERKSASRLKVFPGIHTKGHFPYEAYNTDPLSMCYFSKIIGFENKSLISSPEDDTKEELLFRTLAYELHTLYTDSYRSLQSCCKVRMCFLSQQFHTQCKVHTHRVYTCNPTTIGQEVAGQKKKILEKNKKRSYPFLPIPIASYCLILGYQQTSQSGSKFYNAGFQVF